MLQYARRVGPQAGSARPQVGDQGLGKTAVVPVQAPQSGPRAYPETVAGTPLGTARYEGPPQVSRSSGCRLALEPLSLGPQLPRPRSPEMPARAWPPARLSACAAYAKRSSFCPPGAGAGVLPATALAGAPMPRSQRRSFAADQAELMAPWLPVAEAALSGYYAATPWDPGPGPARSALGNGGSRGALPAEWVVVAAVAASQ
mmetsp:Transcript_72873/g.190117  ORF Transcript_72873/g.190117 Transcript_72873/m.190117 type:complete len:202 (-) Transcript_72873:136-741(-)